jgi:hypothetical protein
VTAAMNNGGPYRWDLLAHNQEQPRPETTVPTMGVTSTLYRIVELLHILAAIVGFGGLIAYGAYNANAFKGKASDAVAVLKSTASVSNIAMNAIYVVFALGIALIALSDGFHSFGHPWVSASFVVWFAIVGISHGMVRPAVAALTDAASAAAPDSLLSEDTGAMAAAKKLAVGEGLVQLLLAAALVLMVFQFGGT